jgi:hypothetical protein
MKLNIDDLDVATFTTGATEEAGEDAYSTSCWQSCNTLCVRTCVTCNGCETGSAGAC